MNCLVSVNFSNIPIFAAWATGSEHRAGQDEACAEQEGEREEGRQESIWGGLVDAFGSILLPQFNFFVAFVCRENLRRGIIPYVSHFWSSSIVLQWTHFSFSGNPSQMPGYRRNCWPCSGWSCIFKIITFCLDTSFICFDRSTKDKRLGRKEHQRYEYLLCFEPWNRKFRFWSFFIMVKLKRWRQEIPSENGMVKMFWWNGSSCFHVILPWAVCFLSFFYL